ncbi:Gag polyprotein, partial [Bienertia sinuspersici]
MKDEIAVDFALALSAQHLWLEISERFAQSSAPLLFELKRDLANLEQGDDMGVAEYYSKMKRKWDEIKELDNIPECTCGALSKCTCEIYQKLKEKEEKSRIIDFLMKLNPNFKEIRGQILAMDPLPNMNRVFQLVHQSEREKKVTNQFQGVRESTAFMAQKGKKVQGVFPKRDYQKEKMEKMKLLCEHCGKRGHNVETGCFDLIGYPKWYKEYKGNKGKEKVAANVEKEEEQESPLDDADDSEIELNHRLVNAVAKQLMKMRSSGNKSEGEIFIDDINFRSKEQSLEDADAVFQTEDVPQQFEPDTHDGMVLETTDQEGESDLPQIHEQQPELRRSTRERRIPEKLKDYEHSIPGKNVQEQEEKGDQSSAFFSANMRDNVIYSPDYIVSFNN